MVSSSLNQQNVLYNILKSCFELIQGVKDARIFLLENEIITCCAEMDADGKLCSLLFPRQISTGGFISLSIPEEMTVCQDTITGKFPGFPASVDWLDHCRAV